MKSLSCFTPRIIPLGVYLALPLMTELSTGVAQAGLMHPEYHLQTYRDFAENRGVFAAGNKNVTVHFKDGSSAGVIPEMMSFESVTDGGFAALTARPQFVFSVAHNGGYQDVSFTKRFGGDDHYRVIKKNNGWGENTDYTYDVQVARLDKLVTEAAPVPVMTDAQLLKNLVGKLVFRVGGGTQAVAITDDKSEHVGDAYTYLTGGTLIFNSIPVNPPNPKSQAPAAKYPAYQFQYNLRTEKDPKNPLPIGVLAGDSGSAAWTYNDKTKRWEYMGTGQSGGGGGFSQMRAANEWCMDVVKSYDNPFIKSSDNATLRWLAPDDSGKGKIMEGKKEWIYQGLPKGKSFAQASLEELEATRNIVFETPARVLLESPIDMGSGIVHVEKKTIINPKTLEDTLSAGGFIVEKDGLLALSCKGKPGDEWRKTGEGALLIIPPENNPVTLNIGEGVVQLAGMGVQCAEDVKLVSGRGELQLAGNGHLRKPVKFGARGGTLNMAGVDLTWSEIPHLDNGAHITSKRKKDKTHEKADIFTYRGKGAYYGKFSDGGAPSDGLLSLVFFPENQEDTWTLHGHISHKGGTTLNSGTLILEGYPTPHAGNYVDPDDWQTARVETGATPWLIHPGATLVLSHHLDFFGKILVESDAQLVVDPQARIKGIVTLQQGATLHLRLPTAPSSSTPTGQASEKASEKALPTLDIQGPVTLIVSEEGKTKTVTREEALNLLKKSFRLQGKPEDITLKTAP